MPSKILAFEDASIKRSSKRNQQRGVKPKWQDRLLPLMTRLLVGLTVFFFLATFIQMAYLHWSILRYPTMDVYFSSKDNLYLSTDRFDEKLAARKLEILSSMEAYVIERRYHQASVLLMGRLWVRYLGFLTGMILSLVGASFILGKLREPVTEIVGKTAGVDLALKSASPGIVLVALGVVLMFATIVDNDYIDVYDKNIYISPVDEAVATETSNNPMTSPDEVFGTLTPVP